MIVYERDESGALIGIAIRIVDVHLPNQQDGGLVNVVGSMVSSLELLSS